MKLPILLYGDYDVLNEDEWIEAIVRHCAKVCLFVGDESEGRGEGTGAKKAALAILAEFGLEE